VKIMLTPAALKASLLPYRNSLMKGISRLDVGVGMAYIERLGTELEVHLPKGARAELCLKI